MKTGQCPGCGAPIDFAAGTGKIKVCEHCHTVVVRGDTSLESMGKVAELTDTESPLKLGISGRANGVAFRIVGRIQKSHGTGTWDEWCLTFDDGRTAWLSESEGQWNLMDEAGDVQLPAFEHLKPLTPFTVHGKRFVIEELGQATTVSAEGELPDFAHEHRYADATGPGGVFASVDFGGDKPFLFVGRTLALSELGFSTSDLQATPKREALHQARCTQCNGALDLKAPDAARRVACPYCGALLDVSHGQLAFLQMLTQPVHTSRLPLGSKGTLQGTQWTVLAFLIRSCKVEGTRYGWDEYLLWNVDKGFRWLMLANGHWTFLTPIAAGDVGFSARNATYQGVTYRQYQSVMAVTEHVQGECYWEVSQGEQAFTWELVAPPKSINVDRTQNEATVTLGEMVSRDDIMKAFALKTPLPFPQGVASAQVNAWRAKATSAWKWTAVWAAGLLAVFIAFAVMAPSGHYLDTNVNVPSDAKPGTPEAMVFSQPFTLPTRAPLSVEVVCPDLSNSWCGVQVDLINEKTDEVVSLYAEPSYYFGDDSDGHWSEGSNRESKTTDEMDPGTYVARTTVAFEATKPVPQVELHVSSDGPGFCCFFFFLLAMLIYPGFASFSAGQFETRRWEDSVFQQQQFTS